MVTDKRNYDVIIIGGGPAGLTAGIYTSRARLSSLLIERELIGGQIANIDRLENFPGFPEGIGGFELAQMMHQQATQFGLTTINADATGIEIQEGNKKLVKTTEGDFTAKAVIISGASKRRKMGVPGEEEFSGKGVSYCATCDAPLFRDQPIAVIGGDSVAITEALHLAKFASKVTVVHRRDKLHASRILEERALAEPKIAFLWRTVVDAVEGESFVQRLRLHQAPGGEKSTLEVTGVFVAMGFQPDTAYLKDILEMDPIGHIITNENMETKVPGILAAGDIRHNSARQAITAAGDGATAAIYADRFLNEHE